MRKRIINLVVGLVGLALSIFTGLYFQNPLLGFVTAFMILSIRLQVEILLNQHRARDIDIEVFSNYGKLRESKCDLFREAANIKVGEANRFLGDLISGRLRVQNINAVYTLLQRLFCNIGFVKRIHATSSGEKGEWREVNSWWRRSYLDIHKKATNRGVKIQRIFILSSDEEQEAAADVFRLNQEYKVVVKTARQKAIAPEDLRHAANCMVFYDKHDVAVYCLQAIHDDKGQFVEAIINNNPELIRPVLDAYIRIDSVASLFKR